MKLCVCIYFKKNLENRVLWSNSSAVSWRGILGQGGMVQQIRCHMECQHPIEDFLCSHLDFHTNTLIMCTMGGSRCGVPPLRDTWLVGLRVPNFHLTQSWLLWVFGKM